VQQVDFDILDEQAKFAYLSEIDEQTWNSNKTDTKFTGQWTGYLGPMSADFSYAQFDEARRQFFQRINYQRSASTFMQKLRRYLTDAQVNAWRDCMLAQGRYGLFLLEKSVNDFIATFELVWVHPPDAPDEVALYSELVGGRSVDAAVPKGKVFADGERMRQGTKVFSIERDTLMPLTVNVSAGGYAASVTVESTFQERVASLETRCTVLQKQLDDYRSSFGIAVANGPTISSHSGVWGGWKSVAMAPNGHYVAGIQVRFEDPVDGDDTALNAVNLICRPFPK
jgi:hypothetical protein